MTRRRSSRRRRTINRYVVGALTIAIIGVTVGALVAVHVAVSGHRAAMDGWGSAGAVTFVLVGIIGAALAALTTSRRT